MRRDIIISSQYVCLQWILLFVMQDLYVRRRYRKL